MIQMLGNYSNPRVQKNLLVVTVLSSVSLGFAFFVGIGYCFALFALDRFSTALDLLVYKVVYQILFYEMLIFVPLVHLLFACRRSKRLRKRMQTKDNNDMVSTITPVSMTFFPFMLLLFCLCFDMPWIYFGETPPIVNDLSLWSVMCGALGLPYLFLLIADGFLLYNVVLIKREWLINPPAFIAAQYAKEAKEKAERQQKIDDEKTQQWEATAETIYAHNIDVCGIRFFIKYYRTITHLPVPDIEVTENYPTAEKTERLLAAKRIVTAGAAEYAFRKILNAYSDVFLHEEEIGQVKAILEEIANEKSAATLKTDKESTDTHIEDIPILKVQIKLWMVLYTVLLCLAWIPIAWTIPMTVYYFIRVKKRRPVGIAFGICALLFIGVLPGALILCDAAKVPNPPVPSAAEKIDGTAPSGSEP